MNRPRWRRVMDWLNPVEWAAWIYGRVFQNHALVGGLFFVGLIAGVGLLVWVRGVDKYRDEHPPKAEIGDLSPKPQAVTSQAQTVTAMPSAAQTATAPAKEASTTKARPERLRNVRISGFGKAIYVAPSASGVTMNGNSEISGNDVGIKSPNPKVPITLNDHSRMTSNKVAIDLTPDVIPPPQPTQPAVNYAPQGFAISGGTVIQPTINNLDTERELTAQSAPKLTAQIEGYSGSAYFSCVGGSSEQQNLARQLVSFVTQVKGWEKSSLGAADAMVRESIHGIEVRTPAGQERAGEALVRGLIAAGFTAHSAPRGDPGMFPPNDAIDVLIGSKR